MLNQADSIYIGDSIDTSIIDSNVGVIALVPRISVGGVHVANTTYRAVTCKASVAISGLSGLACP